MTLVELESRMSHLWAKSPRLGNPPVTLFEHTFDVTRQLAEYCRVYRPTWPIPEEPICLERVLAYAALTHDFGKVHVDFQAALRNGGPPFRNRHEVLSLGFLGYLGIPPNELSWLEAAVALHHKNLFRLVGASQPFFLGSTFAHDSSTARKLVEGAQPRDVELLLNLLKLSEEVFRMTGWRGFPTYPVVCTRLDFLKRIREALERVLALEKQFHAQSDEWGQAVEPLPWPARRAGVLIRGFVLKADHLASFRPHPLHVGLECVDDVYQAIAPRLREGLKSHQEKAAATIGSAILVAPTGTGKTEAGLLWAGRQAESGGLRGRTFVLLPYQASMNAMQCRLIRDFAPQVSDKVEEWEAHVALIHGRSMRAAYERLLDHQYSPDKASAVARLQSDLARLNVAPIRVCSPFQLVRVLFAPKGVEGLIIAFTDARLIFDEIHAYQPEVTALALAAIRLLTEHFGSRIFFMTATLPSHLRKIINRVLGPLPLLVPEGDSLGRPPRHRLRLVSRNVLCSDSLHEIALAAKRGSVLVVVNQVRRAIGLFRALKGSVDVHLLHSRLTHSDRFQRERQIEPTPGRVLISTQAVEVSLDLDYDECFSELAPLESLLQRFGRCNRRGKKTDPASVTVYAAFPSGASKPSLPYRDEHLHATQQTLEDCIRSEQGLLLDSSLQRMLDSSYPEPLKNELAEQMLRKSEELNEHFVRPFTPFGMQDGRLLAELDERWEQLFDGQEVLPESLHPQAAQADSWLERARYLVPISGRKYATLKRQGRIEWDGILMCDVVKATYTQEGLDV